MQNKLRLTYIKTINQFQPPQENELFYSIPLLFYFNCRKSKTRKGRNTCSSHLIVKNAIEEGKS